MNCVLHLNVIKLFVKQIFTIILLFLLTQETWPMGNQKIYKQYKKNIETQFNIGVQNSYFMAVLHYGKEPKILNRFLLFGSFRVHGINHHAFSCLFFYIQMYYYYCLLVLKLLDLFVLKHFSNSHFFLSRRVPPISYGLHSSF